jgi:hypothetical protein
MQGNPARRRRSFGSIDPATAGERTAFRQTMCNVPMSQKLEGMWEFAPRYQVGARIQPGMEFRMFTPTVLEDMPAAGRRCVSGNSARAANIPCGY